VGRFRAIAAWTAAAAIAGCNSSNAIPNQSPTLHPITHVIVMMQENRSFNNLFAGFPGAMTAMSGPCLPAPWCKSGTLKLHPVTLETTNHLGLGTDIDHSHNGFKIECDLDTSGDCRNDGFDKIRHGETGEGELAKTYPYAYVDRSETKAYWDFAKRYALADNIFFTDTASSFIAHQIILSGTVRLNSDESLTDEPDDEIWGCDAFPYTTTPVLRKDGKEFTNGPFPCFTEYGTLADLLDAAHVSWKYYVAPVYGDFSGDVWDGFDAIAKVRCNTFTPPEKCQGQGADWKAHMSFPNTTFFSNLKAGTLPAVSWLIPQLAESDHPASGCNHGPHWVTSVVNAVGESKYWDSTAIILLWDDWGGWYDPAPPPQTNYTSLGFRMPMMVISPLARAATVVHTQYQYGSILKFIEENFGLGSLDTTDATSTSIGDMFDYNQRPARYVREPLPSERICTGHPTAQQIIQHAGGVPE